MPGSQRSFPGINICIYLTKNLVPQLYPLLLNPVFEFILGISGPFGVGACFEFIFQIFLHQLFWKYGFLVCTGIFRVIYWSWTTHIFTSPLLFGKKKHAPSRSCLFFLVCHWEVFPRCIAVCLIYKAGECSYKEDVYINWSFIVARPFLGETTGNNITAITTNVVA